MNIILRDTVISRVNKVIPVSRDKEKGTKFIAWTGANKSILYSIQRVPKTFYEVFPKPYIISFAGSLALLGLYFMMVKIKSRRMARILFDSIYTDASRGIIWIDREDRIFKINERAIHILKMQDKKTTGLHYQNLPQNNRSQMLAQAVQNLSRSGDIQYSGTFKIQTDKGEEEFLVQASRIGDPRSKGLGKLVMMEDVSALAKAKTLETWTVLTRGLSHGIKNPLALATAKLKTFFGRNIDDESKMEAIIENLDEVAEYVEKLSRPPVGSSDNVKCDVNQVAKEVVLRKRLILPENVEIEASLAPGAMKATIDETVLRGVLSELVDNALDATKRKEKGKITLSTDVVRSNKGENHLKKFSGQVRIEVADNGDGIPEEIIDKLGILGETSKGKGHTGTGLWWVMATVEQHGGSLKWETQQGVGARFIITLPLSQRKE